MSYYAPQAAFHERPSCPVCGTAGLENMNNHHGHQCHQCHVKTSQLLVCMGISCFNSRIMHCPSCLMQIQQRQNDQRQQAEEAQNTQRRKAEEAKRADAEAKRLADVARDAQRRKQALQEKLDKMKDLS
jgi:hypothetical protein